MHESNHNSLDDSTKITGDVNAMRKAAALASLRATRENKKRATRENKKRKVETKYLFGESSSSDDEDESSSDEYDHESDTDITPGRKTEQPFRLMVEDIPPEQLSSLESLAFAHFADFCAVKDLLNLAAASKTAHKGVQKLKWNCHCRDQRFHDEDETTLLFVHSNDINGKAGSCQICHKRLCARCNFHQFPSKEEGGCTTCGKYSEMIRSAQRCCQDCAKPQRDLLEADLFECEDCGRKFCREGNCADVDGIIPSDIPSYVEYKCDECFKSFLLEHGDGDEYDYDDDPWRTSVLYDEGDGDGDDDEGDGDGDNDEADVDDDEAYGDDDDGSMSSVSTTGLIRRAKTSVRVMVNSDDGSMTSEYILPADSYRAGMLERV